MSTTSSLIRDCAIAGARIRLDAIGEEITSITLTFPELARGVRREAPPARARPERPITPAAARLIASTVISPARPPVAPATALEAPVEGKARPMRAAILHALLSAAGPIPVAPIIDSVAALRREAASPTLAAGVRVAVTALVKGGILRRSGPRGAFLYRIG